MDILKTPHEKLMEEAGVNPASPGWLNTPKQLLNQEAGVTPAFANGGQVQMSPQDMLAMLFANGQAPQHYASGGAAAADDQFGHILELAKRDPSFLKKLSHHTLGFIGKAFDKANPIFQAQAAYDAGERGIDALERAHQGDYRGATISGLGAVGAGLGILPGGVPQVLSIPATMGADYLQQHYDETDPHKSRFSLKNTTLNK